jgi:hypothetical protein
VSEVPELRVDIDREVIKEACYTNFAIIAHQANEFYLDFTLLQPSNENTTVAVVHTRIITSPQHAKAFLRSLAENVQRYENTFGVIPEATSGGQA